MNNIYTFSGNIHLPDPNCPIYWMGSSKKDLMALPLEVRKFFGHALDFGIALTKKSKRGIATPKADMDLIRLRLKEAQSKAKEME